MTDQMDRLERSENERRSLTPASTEVGSSASSQRGRGWRRLATCIVAVALAAAACADDTAQEPESEFEVPVEPARGAADSVDTDSEGGKDLTENLNVPGSDAAEEIDE